jgi:hypothetical protein
MAGFLSGRPEMPSCTIFYSIADVVGTGPSTGNTATSTAGMVPVSASRTLESHNTMQQCQHASSPFPKVYSMCLSSNCSLPYVFSNSFHPRISTGHQGMHMYLVWLLVFCFVLGGVVTGLLGRSSIGSDGARAPTTAAECTVSS